MSSIAEMQSTLNNITSSTNSAYAAKSVKGSSDLGQDAFLRLMIEQMKNQDPTSPTDNSEMIAQTAQFTQVQEMQKLNSTMSTMNSNSSMNQALGLIGKSVVLTDPADTSKTITGTVTGLRTDGTNSYLVIDNNPDKAYSAALIRSVSTPGLSASTSTGTTGTTGTTGSTGSTTTSTTTQTS